MSLSASKTRLSKNIFDELNINTYKLKDIPNLILGYSTNNTITILNGEIKINNTSVKTSSDQIEVINKNSLLNNFNNIINFDIDEDMDLTIINALIGSDNSLKIQLNIKKNINVNITEINKSVNSKLNKTQVIINAKANSTTSYKVVSMFEELDYSYQRYDLVANNDSVINMHIGALNNTNSYTDIMGNCIGKNSEINVNTVAISGGDEYHNLVVNVENNEMHSRGNIKNYAISNHNSSLIVDGIGKITKGNAKSEAFQTTRALILSKNSNIHANPLLLIDEYDVKAGHGAVVGKIDENHLYYLMSRGLNEIEATQLIIEGYVNELYKNISNDLLKEDTKIHILKKLR